LALGRPSQLLDLSNQLTDAGLQPLVLTQQPLELAGELIALRLRRLALGGQQGGLLA
jgi:hypothetical protein